MFCNVLSGFLSLVLALGCTMWSTKRNSDPHAFIYSFLQLLSRHPCAGKIVYRLLLQFVTEIWSSHKIDSKCMCQIFCLVAIVFFETEQLGCVFFLADLPKKWCKGVILLVLGSFGVVNSSNFHEL